jgi:flavin-dependent dehydrogenase
MVIEVDQVEAHYKQIKKKDFSLPIVLEREYLLNIGRTVEYLQNAGSRRPEVLVAGGGPTGLWLACELALTGLRVAVLERLAKPTGLSKALGLQARSMEMLEHRGILDRFTAGNPTPPFLNFGIFALDLRRLDFPHPYGVVIPQARIEALLEQRANELDAEIRRGHEVIGLLPMYTGHTEARDYKPGSKTPAILGGS